MYFRFRFGIRVRVWLICYQSPEVAVIQLFTEVRRRKPSVVYIPDVGNWYKTVGEAALSTLVGLLRKVPSTDPILVLGVLECEPHYIDHPQMLKDLFGGSRKNRFDIQGPDWVSGLQFPQTLLDSNAYMCIAHAS